MIRRTPNGGVEEVARVAHPALDLVDDQPADDRSILYVDDIQRLLGFDVTGKPRRSSWWVRKHVAPDKKFTLGQLAAWYRADVLDWLDTQSTKRQSA